MPFAPLYPLLPSDVESRSTFYQQLKEEWRITPCLNRLERRHYVSGETVGAEVKGLAGKEPGLF